ncbi:hypothetical protein Glove_87g230 [Diversispora epigaea]|uniref:Uncharacterized protein n=1 Tax=Diversispora epigaea TaxID=1348612 RepID=A0A397JCZ6_9GLOM|nr:hypothetical protein Glove_87g230 [Diversispora epigaea]
MISRILCDKKTAKNRFECYDTTKTTGEAKKIQHQPIYITAQNAFYVEETKKRIIIKFRKVTKVIVEGMNKSVEGKCNKPKRIEKHTINNFREWVNGFMDELKTVLSVSILRKVVGIETALNTKGRANKVLVNYKKKLYINNIEIE